MKIDLFQSRGHCWVFPLFIFSIQCSIAWLNYNLPVNSLLRMPTWMSPLLMKSLKEYSLYVSFLYTWETFSRSEIARLKGSYVFKSTRYCQTTLLYLLPPELLCFTVLFGHASRHVGFWFPPGWNSCPLWWKCGVLNTGSLGTRMLRLFTFCQHYEEKNYISFFFVHSFP